MIKIIYEDENILALNKPAGIDVVGIGDWLNKNYPGAQLAHRLDKDTSGVILAAKNEVVREYLKKLFQTGGIKKKYLALVYGHPPGGTIDLTIGRSRKDPRRRIAGKGATGKLREAVTVYKKLEDLGEYSLVEANPQTGRTHQLRVHFKALGYPIINDKLYAPASLLAQSAALPIARQALHAAQIEFVGPNGKALKLESPLPADFQAALDNLRASC